MTMVESRTILQLVEDCRAETNLYKKGKQSNEVYCLELFRRALTQQNEAAWQAIYTQYQDLVTMWVCSYSRFSQTGEEADFFVNGAFGRMWQFGTKPGTAKNLDSLGKCLRYLKLCVGSAIEDHHRKEKKDALNIATATLADYDNPVSTDENQGESTGSLSELRVILWETVEKDEERLVAEESWVYGFAPRQIQARNPETFATTEEVSQIKHNIIKRLRRRLKMKK